MKGACSKTVVSDHVGPWTMTARDSRFVHSAKDHLPKSAPSPTPRFVGAFMSSSGDNVLACEGCRSPLDSRLLLV